MLPIRYWARCLVWVVTSILAMGPFVPLAAQAPLDLLGTHFGAIRRPTIANQAWAVGSAMLITELDGRLESEVPLPGNPPFIQHDNLDTTVGYNYATLGFNWVAFNNFQNYAPFLPAPTAVTLPRRDAASRPARRTMRSISARV